VKIKIVHILISISGIDTYLRYILDNIDLDKFEFVIIHANHDNAKFDNYKGHIKEYKIDIKKSINPLYDFKTLQDCYLILKKEKPNLIHCHSSKGGVFGRICGLLLNIPQFYTPHAFSFLSTQHNILKSIYIKIEKSLHFKNSYILACSKSEALLALETIKISPKQILTWENSVSLPIKITTPEIPLPESYFCTAGRPSYQKNFELLLDAFKEVKAKYNSISLIIAGVGNDIEKDNLQLKIEELELQNNVILVPWIEKNNLYYIIQHSLSFVSTSRYEGLPYVLLEAMSLKKNCVVSNVLGNKELIQHQFNGLLFNNKKELVDSLLYIIENKQQRETFDNNNFSLFKENYDINTNIKKLDQLYTKYYKK